MSFELSWSGKRTRTELDAMRESAVQLEDYPLVWLKNDVSVFHGNAEDILAALPENSIDIVYIDPPYNSRQKFKTYSDDFAIPVAEYKQEHQIKGKLTSLEECDRLHCRWLTLMQSCLYQARCVMRNDAILFISCDEHELYNLKVLCDEIFHPSNFIGQLNWMKTETPANLARKLKRKIEYILVYQGGENKERFYGTEKKSKSSNGLMNQSNKVREIIFSANKVKTALPDKIYEPGKYGSASYDIELLAPTRVAGHLFVEPIHLRGKFKWSQDKVIAEENNPDTEIFIQSEAFSPSYIRHGVTSRDVPTNFISKEECGVQTSEDATKHLKTCFGGDTVFDYPKPVSLIQFLIEFRNLSNCTVLDFFAGSGTTAEAVLKHNLETGDCWKTILIEQDAINISNIIERLEKNSDKENN